MQKVNSIKIFKRIENLEKQIQRLKLEAFFALPSKKKVSFYPEKSLLRTIKQTRESIWQERYAKKV